MPYGTPISEHEGLYEGDCQSIGVVLKVASDVNVVFCAWNLQASGALGRHRAVACSFHQQIPEYLNT